MARFCDFPDGVLEEIMSWLPPESLERFKCVCKSWYVLINSLINDPKFVAKHLHNTTVNMLPSPTTCFWKLEAISHQEPEGKQTAEEGTHLLTMATRDFEVNNYIPCLIGDLKFLVRKLRGDRFKLASHCNGIICLHAHCRKEFICLLNPALKEFKIVLNAGLGDGFKIRAVGFGYDFRANDYKVVFIKSNDRSYQAEVYTLSTNSWKEIELGIDVSNFPYSGHQTLYCNGVCYWYYLNQGSRKIISFDVVDEVFHSILPPEKVMGVEKKWRNLVEWSKIAVWNNSIVLFFYVKAGPAVVDMWVMDASSGGVEASYTWTKHITIGPLVGIKRPLAFLDNNVLFLETTNHKITSFNIRTRTINDLSIHLENFRNNRFVIYARTLVSILKRERKNLTVDMNRRSSGASSSKRSIMHGVRII